MGDLWERIETYRKQVVQFLRYAWSIVGELFRRDKTPLQNRIKEQPWGILGGGALLLAIAGLLQVLSDLDPTTPLSALLSSENALSIMFGVLGVAALFAGWLRLFGVRFVHSFVSGMLLFSVAVLSTGIIEKMFNVVAPIIAPTRYAADTKANRPDFDKALNGEVTYATLAACIPANDPVRSSTEAMYTTCFGPTWTYELALTLHGQKLPNESEEQKASREGEAKKSWCKAIGGVTALSTGTSGFVATVTQYLGMTALSVLPFLLVALNLGIHPQSSLLPYRVGAGVTLIVAILVAFQIFVDKEFSGPISQPEVHTIATKAAKARVCEKVLRDWPAKAVTS